MPSSAQFDSPRRRLFRAAVSLCLISEMALCPRLWTGIHRFPSVPAFPGLPALPPVVSIALTVLLLGCVVGGNFILRPRFATFGVLGFGGLLVLFDIDRLQPWFWMELLLFAGLDLAANAEEGWAVCGFVVGATYVWSGLQKVCSAFGDRVFPWILQPFRLGAFHHLWWTVPIVEVAIGVCLLSSRARLVGVIGAVVMHGLLLIGLGPFGHDYNRVVWPWNFWMAAFVGLLFYRKPDPLFGAVWRSRVGKVGMVLAGVCPGLSFFGLWDDSISDSLYSGKSSTAFLVFSPEGARSLPDGLQPYLEQGKRTVGLSLFKWSMADLGVPPYPERRVFQAVARDVLATCPGPVKCGLFVTDRPNLVNGELFGPGDKMKAVPIAVR